MQLITDNIWAAAVPLPHLTPQLFLPRHPPHIRRDPLPLHLLPPYLLRHSDDGSITHIGNQSFGWRARQGVET
jgi:hypothetical protein